MEPMQNDLLRFLLSRGMSSEEAAEVGRECMTCGSDTGLPHPSYFSFWLNLQAQYNMIDQADAERD